MFRHKRNYAALNDSKIVVSNAGVYKLGQTTKERMATPVVGPEGNFKPLDFMESRKGKN